jgi:hypothetical protein
VKTAGSAGTGGWENYCRKVEGEHVHTENFVLHYFIKMINFLMG